MIVIYLLIPLSFVTAAVFLVGFFWAIRSGQYDDTTTPAMRVLSDDSETAPKAEAKQPVPGAEQKIREGRNF